jgi:hypothetical protein
MRNALILSILLGAQAARAADLTIMNPSKTVDRSSGTIVNVAISTSIFTLADAPQMEGSDYVIVQSTHANGTFCCSYESTASSLTVAGTRGCQAAQKEPGLGFYEMRFNRWWQNLRVYCLSLRTGETSAILRVRQGK